MEKPSADAIALWVEAALLAQQNKRRLGSIGGINSPLREDRKWRSLGSNHYFVDRLNKPNNPCFRSLVVGATPENGYRYNPKKISVEVVREEEKTRMVTNFLYIRVVRILLVPYT